MPDSKLSRRGQRRFIEGDVYAVKYPSIFCIVYGNTSILYSAFCLPEKVSVRGNVVGVLSFQTHRDSAETDRVITRGRRRADEIGG
jgi:hypothetical protein